MVRLIDNRARIHFNAAVEQARELNYFEALGELNSALELNSRLVEAHVLKGSILGRLERVDEAREALEEALRISPQGARAHRYLLELGDVEKTAPIRRRLTTMFGVAGAVTVGALLIAGAVLLLQPGPPPPDSRGAGEAWGLLAAGDLAGAQKAGEHLPQPEKAGLHAAIERSVQDVLELSTVVLESHGPEAALAVLAKLDDMKLRPLDEKAVARQVALMATANADQAGALMQSLVEQTTVGGATPFPALEKLKAAMARHAALFPKYADSLERALAEPRAEARALVVSRLAAINGDGDSHTAAKDLSAVAPLEELLGMDGSVTARLGELSARDAEDLYSEAMTAAREGKTDAFDAALSAIRALPVAQPEMAEKAAALRGILVEREQREMITALQRALDAGERETALQIATTLEAMGGTPTPELAARLVEARERVAIDSYYTLMKWGDRIESGEITRAEAEEVHRLVALARGPLPARIASKATDNLHFFAAQAWRVLGESEKAWEEMGELRRIHPDSIYLRVN
jgi:tetratricopeptide (TPR) repeat protein